MTSSTFPDIDEPVTAKDSSVRDAEKLLVGYAVHNLSALDHADGLREHHFLDDDLRTVYRRLLSERAAGSVETDPALVGLEDISSPAELERFEKLAPSIKPDRIKTLARKVIEGWQGRELRRSMNVLGFDDGPVSDRIEAARRRLDHIAGAVPGRAAGDDHPLGPAQFVTLRKVPQAVKWVVPGVIEHGVVTIAGARGVGKTTSLLPLALSAAGLHEPGYPLAPRPDRWRHIIYAVEQVEQAERILAGLVECSGMGITWEQVEQRLHLVEAVRLDVDTVVQVAGTYREQFTRVVDGVEILPLVVFDTQSASFDMDNESDNAEAGRIMAALKQRFEKLPIWIVGHVAKAAIGLSDVPALSARGAGAFEGDAIQNCYLIQEGEQRFLAIGKHRAEPRFGKELMIEAADKVVTGYNEWNEPEDVHLRWAIVRPSDITRQEARQQAQEAEELVRRGDMRVAIMDAVQVAWQAGNPINKTGVKSAVRGFKTQDVGNEVEALLAESWLHEVEVPKAQRTNTKRDRFLVRLTTEEHDDFMRSGIVPAAKLVVPQSWRKPEIPFVPEVDAEDAEKQAPDA